MRMFRTLKKTFRFYENVEDIKFECLLYEMLYIRDLKPSLNKQSDSISSQNSENTRNALLEFADVTCTIAIIMAL